MGYEGAVLGALPTPVRTIPDRARELVPAVARAIVDDGTDYMLGQVKVNTPKSEPPAVPGYPYLPGGDGVHLRDEIHRSETIEDMDGFEAQVGSDKSYVLYVEDGTGLYGPKHAKYLIEPHNPGGLLAWPGADGKMRYARSVWHPGSPGQFMFLIGGRMTEASMPELRTRGDLILQEGMR